MRKRVIGILLLLSVAGTLTGCVETNETTEEERTTGIFEKIAIQENEKRNTISSIDSYDVYDYVDPETGVHYLIYSQDAGYAGMGGMTPRLNADGSLMVDETVIQDDPHYE